MKRNFLVVAFLFACIILQAQPPQGGGRAGGFGGGSGGGRPPMDRNRGENSSQQFWVMKVPEIPGLTEDQRFKLVDVLSKEQEEMSKVMDEKREVDMKTVNLPELSEKDRNKQLKTLQKIDVKREKINAKYDKKYRKILSEDQYRVFIEKKKQVEFKGQGRPRKAMAGERMQRRDDNRNEGFDDRGTPPDMPDGDFGF